MCDRVNEGTGGGKRQGGLGGRREENRGVERDVGCVLELWGVGDGRGSGRETFATKTTDQFSLGIQRDLDQDDVMLCAGEIASKDEKVLT